MANSQRVHIVYPTQHLVHEYFGINAIKWVKTHKLKEILVIRLHGDVKVLIFGLFSDKGGNYFDDEWIIEHFYYFQLSCFVFLILLHSLQSNHLPRTLYPRTKHLSECACSNQLLYLQFTLLKFLWLCLYLKVGQTRLDLFVEAVEHLQRLHLKGVIEVSQF